MTRLRLFYSPGACSLASHIALEEAGADYEAVTVDFGAAEQRSPAYLAVNPKGRVPALVEGDRVLTETPAILSFVAKRHPAAALWPSDPWRDAVCAEWLAWLASTVHVAYAHLRRPERYAEGEAAKDDVRRKGRAASADLWRAIEARLPEDGWALGGDCSVLDAYLMVFWHWGRGEALGLAMARDFPRWTAQARRMAGRPAVQRVFAREGLALPD